MLKVVDLNYYAHADISKPVEVLEIQKASIGFAKFIENKLNIRLVKHMNYEGEQCIDNVQYVFFKKKNHFFHVPFKTHSYLRRLQPDIILIQGLIFPLQLISLKIHLKKSTKIIVQHHGEKPFARIKKGFQQLADRYINAYVFTSLENANEWIEKKIILNKNKCFELLEASTHFRQKDKAECKILIGLKSNLNLLWVGRLNEGKDPITILNAFEKFVCENDNARLHMIYQTEELLPEIKRRINQNDLLKRSVILKGKLLHHELETWYNAADFFISGSHKEGSGYALLEAMACGCIPVVTNIPTFVKITNDGEYGFLFKPGDENSLLKILSRLKYIHREKLTNSIVQHFNNSLSFKSIAEKLYFICQQVAIE